MSGRRLSESLKKRLAYEQKWSCFVCGNMLPPTFQVDHIVPHAIGGSNHPSNLQALCVECHARKSQSELKRIKIHKALSAECANSKSYTTCWFCHRILSTYFRHTCDNRGEEAVFDEAVLSAYESALKK